MMNKSHAQYVLTTIIRRIDVLVQCQTVVLAFVKNALKITSSHPMILTLIMSQVMMKERPIDVLYAIKNIQLMNFLPKILPYSDKLRREERDTCNIKYNIY